MVVVVGGAEDELITDVWTTKFIDSDHLKFVERSRLEVVQSVMCQRPVMVFDHHVPRPVHQRLREVVRPIDHLHLDTAAVSYSSPASVTVAAEL